MLFRVQKQIVRRLVSPNTKQEGTSALLTKMNKNATIDQFFCHFSYCLSFEILFEIKSGAQNEIILWKFPYLSQKHNWASSTLVELRHTHEVAPTIRETFWFHFPGKLALIMNSFNISTNLQQWSPWLLGEGQLVSMLAWWFRTWTRSSSACLSCCPTGWSPPQYLGLTLQRHPLWKMVELT